jgi:hypothetical protein
MLNRTPFGSFISTPKVSPTSSARMTASSPCAATQHELSAPSWSGVRRQLLSIAIARIKNSGPARLCAFLRIIAIHFPV